MVAFALSSMFAQNNTILNGGQLKKATLGDPPSQNFVKCGAPIPSAEWDAEFNKLVDKFIKDHTDPTGKVSLVNYTIPVVFHIIHNQNTITQENIAAARITEQINVLNADYAGTNTDIGSVPTVFQASKAGNTGIQFCKALVDPLGNTLAEPGIERKKWTTIAGATDPALANTSAALQSLFDGTIKPATIWDPTKYLNIWVCKATNSGLLGYASWPAGSGLAGLGTAETNQTSGVVLNYQAVGTSVTAVAPYNKGRTATHEIGHWLGLRHISGDVACGNDYCNDTPLQSGGFAGGQGGLNFSCPTHPFQAGSCTSNTNGEMFMNYMDYVDDACMYMFTANQSTRMQTAMANGTYRKFLGTHGICSSALTVPTAGFTLGNGCAGVAISTTNTSIGNPVPTYSWTTSPSAGVTISNATATNPTITFANAGTYTVSLTATNSQGSNTYTLATTINACSSACDTITSNITDLTNIALYTLDAVSPSDSGYLSGTGAISKAIAEKYIYANNGKLVTGIRVYVGFTTGTGNVTFNVYNDAAGKPGTVLGSKTVSLSSISAFGYHNIMLTTPVTPSATFYVGYTVPTTAAAGDTITTLTTDGTAGTPGTGYFRYGASTWYTYSVGVGMDLSNYIFPIMCAPIGINESNLDTHVNLYPNPNSGKFDLDINLDNASDLKIEVTNMLGQTVYSTIEKAVTSTSKTINLGDMSKGVYVITVSTANDKLVKKIVVE